MILPQRRLTAEMEVTFGHKTAKATKMITTRLRFLAQNYGIRGQLACQGKAVGPRELVRKHQVSSSRPRRPSISRVKL